MSVADIVPDGRTGANAHLLTARGDFKIFIALNGGLSILFALATLYAWIESNAFVADFFITCLTTTLIMLGITFICRRNFLKHNPNYRWRLTDRAKKVPRK